MNPPQPFQKSASRSLQMKSVQIGTSAFILSNSFLRGNNGPTPRHPEYVMWSYISMQSAQIPAIISNSSVLSTSLSPNQEIYLKNVSHKIGIRPVKAFIAPSNNNFQIRKMDLKGFKSHRYCLKFFDSGILTSKVIICGR